ncbi:MAG: nitrogenase component 1 [bacterium]
MNGRAQARLNQVVCTLEGMATLLQATPGNFSVVIHGDRDCVNVLVSGMDHPGAERFFCTNLTEAQAMAGKTRGPLQACLEAVCRGLRPGLEPEVVFLLGTCLTAVIGDDVEPVVREVSLATGAKVVALSGAGMRFVSQSAILDRFACLMLDACEPIDTCEAAAAAAGAADPTSVNLLGFHPGAEILDQLARLGVTVNAVLDRGATVQAWRRLPAAALNLVLDPGLYPEALARAEQRFGVRPLEVTYPLGARSTSAFFGQVLGVVPTAADPAPVLREAEANAMRVVAEARERTRGKRLGYNIGSMKNLRPLTLAREGLVDLAPFEELELDVTILVQGDDRPERLAAVRETLEGFGCTAPLAVFSDTVFFGELCRSSRCQLVYASDHLRDQARGAAVGFLESGALKPGYGAVEHNLQLITKALEGAEGKP